MRRPQAIVLVIILLAAPLSMVVQGASLARQEKQAQLMAQHDDCSHMGVGICGCHQGPMSSLNLLAPMPDMVLPNAVHLPELTIQNRVLRASGFAAPAGYMPVAFHPPRS